MPDALILDPFMDSGTTGIAALLEGRLFVGAELVKAYYDISAERLKETVEGKAKVRENKPVIEPNQNAAVAKLPEEFRIAKETHDEES